MKKNANLPALIFTFALLIIILLIKPNGLFGEKLKEKV